MICLNRLLSFSVTRSQDTDSISMARFIFLIGSMWAVKRSLCFNGESFFRFFPCYQGVPLLGYSVECSIGYLIDC
jgi:hypothetical protein